ncbi:MAG: TRAP transporter large permease subunit, partial [Pirellulales bacterium]|nr:TRAP transporter large permease subunit [Pirellulales bacterium]
MTAALVLGGLLLVLMTGAPVFAALGVTSLIVALISEGHVDAVADSVFGRLNNSYLAVIPMFAFMAHVMIRSRVVDHLYDAANAMVRHVRGGLGVATILACTVFAAISGSSVATALTIGSSALPQMKRYGYRDRDSYGVIAAGGTLGILIPPSAPLIIYAVVTESSIGALFLAGLIPGIMMALIFALFCVASAAGRPGQKRQPWIGWRECLSALRQAIWALMMPPVVLGGIYLGIFTASEAAA